MKCSVIVTSYNQESTLRQTIDSILNQKCNFDFEIIIGDDCSIDLSRDIIISYKNKYENIKPLFQKQNVGVAINLISCVNLSQGKYIAICAADDFWHNQNKLQLEVDFLEQNTDYGLVYTDYDKLNTENGKLNKNWLLNSKLTIYQGANLTRSFFEGKVSALTLTVMFKKELFNKYIPVNDYIRLNFPIEDWPTWLILSYYSKIGYIPISTATYRYNHESLSNIGDYNKLIDKYQREKLMYKYLCELFSDVITFDNERYDDYVNNIILNYAYKKNCYKYVRNIKPNNRNFVKYLSTKNVLLFKIVVYVKYVKNLILKCCDKHYYSYL